MEGLGLWALTQLEDRISFAQSGVEELGGQLESRRSREWCDFREVLITLEDELEPSDTPTMAATPLRHGPRLLMSVMRNASSWKG
ncbi:hypothetical protein AAFF_G00173160 [Aldrovandia affinis]|uniref:Uncharacterized protein n=1 Tax=Aldrovandia affinis TaxID=143900 RepID=A0AAD7SZ39_9TELE|nr:hypothetical protein AAFF_G00173160 [Aldrovandia affinis]